MLPHLLPYLTAVPLSADNASTLAVVVEAAGGAIIPHFHSVLQSLLNELRDEIELLAGADVVVAASALSRAIEDGALAVLLAGKSEVVIIPCHGFSQASQRL